MQTPQPTTWQKSSFSSEGNNCLELGSGPDLTPRLRESDEPATVLTTTPTRLRALLALARSHQPAIERP